MSTQPNMIVAAASGRQANASSLIERLRAHWPAESGPRLNAGNFEELDGLRASTADLVVIIVDAAIDKQRLLGVIEMLDERGIAVAVVRETGSPRADEVTFAGGLAINAGDTAECMAAQLRGLLHRQPRIRQLYQEVSVAQRFQGGLRGEIDKMHEELQLAAMVQREFLPSSIPSLHGMELDALWRPANYVSGDLYNIVRLDEDHIGVFIADAVGHGVPAALMTMIICRSLKPKRIVGDSYELVEPSEVMSLLNEGLILRQGTSARFATGVYALVNCRARTMKIAGAGHPLPLLIRHDGECEELRTSGGLLGIFENEEFDQIEVSINAGDRLIMYSDGFEQAFPDPGASAEKRRLPTQRYLSEFELLRECRSAQEIVAQVQARLDDQTGSLHQHDDLTLIAMLATPLQHAAQMLESAGTWTG